MNRCTDCGKPSEGRVCQECAPAHEQQVKAAQAAYMRKYRARVGRSDKIRAQDRERQRRRRERLRDE